MLSLLCVVSLSSVLYGPSPPVAPLPPLRVELEARAEVGGAILRLSDLAHVESGSLWARLPLGASPAPGTTRVVTRAQVQVALRAHGFALAVTGAERVRVSRRGLANVGARPEATAPDATQGKVLLSGRFLERIAARFVRRELELDPSAPLTLRSELPARWQVPRTAGSRLHARWAGARPQRGDLARVVVEVRSGERALASLELNFERPEPRAAARPSAGPTSKPDLRPAPQPARLNKKSWPKKLRQGPARPLPSKGTPEDKPVELVKRGAHVTVVVRSGSLTITSEGVAEKGGARGESIPVRIAKDRPLIVGRIVDRGRIVVELRPREGE